MKSRLALLVVVLMGLLVGLARPVQAAPLRAFATFDPLDAADDVALASWSASSAVRAGTDRYHVLLGSIVTVPGAAYRITVAVSYGNTSYNNVKWGYADTSAGCVADLSNTDATAAGMASVGNGSYVLSGVPRRLQALDAAASSWPQEGATLCVYGLMPSRNGETASATISRISMPIPEGNAWLFALGSAKAAGDADLFPMFLHFPQGTVQLTTHFLDSGTPSVSLANILVQLGSTPGNVGTIPTGNGSYALGEGAVLALSLPGAMRWVSITISGAALPTAIPTSSAIPAPGQCEDYIIRGSGSGSIRDGEVIQTVAGALTISDGSKSATVPAYPSAAVAPLTLGLAGSGSYTLTGNGTLRICPGALATTTATATPVGWEEGHCIDIVAGAGYTSFPRNAEIAAYGSWTPASAVIEIVGNDPTDRENSAFTFTSTSSSYSSLVPNFAPTKAFVYGSWVYSYKVRVVSGGTLADVAFSALKLCAFGAPDVFPTGTPTRTPTATPWPTPPPYPTQIPYPTWPSYATPPPYPTQIPYPTQRPYLTPPPYPTQIPYPTQRPYPTYPPWPSVVVQFPTATATPEGGTAGTLPGPFPTAWMPQPYNPTALPSSGPPALPGLGTAPTWGPLPTWAAVITSTWSLPGQGVVITATMVALFGPVKTMTAWSETTFGPDPWAKGGADAAPIAAEIGGAFGWLGVLSLFEPFAPLLPPLLIIFFVRLVKLIISVVRYVKQILPVVG
ncbi:hypothetical protein F8S13_12000 [Chloroflexia bacterium SDU3-3]|nr:hypothetical protein F8S13_12000 [Chloroflexia bacterium SDU3-3]